MLPMHHGNLRRGGHGSHIQYTLADSPLDRMLVACTANGVCAVAFGDDSALVTELGGRFPGARLERDDAALVSAVKGVLQVLGGEPLGSTGLQLHVRRTPFQERAWKAMQAIARGQTLTYGELAAQVGSPRGAIAVGQACAVNPVAVLIPCHRVLAKDGRLHHWRWGVERKQRLLAMESVMPGGEA